MKPINQKNFTATEVERLQREHYAALARTQERVWAPIIDRIHEIIKERRLHED